MTRFITLLFAALACGGCSLPLTRATVLVREEAERPLADVTYLPVPEASVPTARTRLVEGLEAGERALPTKRAAAYRRYWAANLGFLFTAAVVIPAKDRRDEPTFSELPRRLVLLAVRCPEGVPDGGAAALSDGWLRLALGTDDLPDTAPAGAWSLRFGHWPELTGAPGTLALWDPVRVQIDADGSGSRPRFGTGLVIDRATWEALAALAAPGQPAPIAPGPLRSTSFVTSANPLRWLVVPGTLLIDAITIGDDDGERHRAWALNRWDFEGR